MQDGRLLVREERYRSTMNFLQQHGWKAAELPRVQRLTDTAWRRELAGDQAAPPFHNGWKIVEGDARGDTAFYTRRLA